MWGCARIETDLYKPVKKYFETQGYKVNAEVKNCDVTAVKEDELIVIELKTAFNVTVLYQAIDRQKITRNVYIAVPKPKSVDYKNISKMRHIADKLGIGLIMVDLSKRSSVAEVLIEPDILGLPKNNRRSREVIKEINERTIEINSGGSTRKKITTAYTQKAIRLAVILNEKGKHKASHLIKEFGCPKNSHQILYNNHYGWFERVGNGLYTLSPTGKEALNDAKYKAFIDIMKEEVNGKI